MQNELNWTLKILLNMYKCRVFADSLMNMFTFILSKLAHVQSCAVSVCHGAGGRGHCFKSLRSLNGARVAGVA